MTLSIFYQISPFYYFYDHFTAAYVLSMATKTAQKQIKMEMIWASLVAQW